MFVKICGICNSEDAGLVSHLKADAIGFVMGGWVLPVEIEPAAQMVRKIIPSLRQSLETVLVTHLETPEEIVALADYIGCSAIQVSEPLVPVALREIRKRTPRLIIKTVTVNELARSYLKAVEDFADYILLDTQVAGYVGGTGKTSDWNLCAELAAAATKPVLLAGGLTSSNVLSGIARVNPSGVDVSTGVSCFSERYPRKDRKDPAKIEEFIRLAKGGPC